MYRRTWELLHALSPAKSPFLFYYRYNFKSFVWSQRMARTNNKSGLFGNHEWFLVLHYRLKLQPRQVAKPETERLRPLDDKCVRICAIRLLGSQAVIPFSDLSSDMLFMPQMTSKFLNDLFTYEYPERVILFILDTGIAVLCTTKYVFKAYNGWRIFAVAFRF